MLLHYFVKCITRYYCVIDMFHGVPNNQQTLLQFSNTTDRHAIDDATDSVCHQIEVGAV